MLRFRIWTAVVSAILGAMLLWAWIMLQVYSAVEAHTGSWSDPQRRILSVTASAAAIAGLIPAFLLSIVAGGNLGGGIGEAALGLVGVPLGLAIGIAVVFNVCMLAASGIGLLLGMLAAVAWHRVAA